MATALRIDEPFVPDPGRYEGISDDVYHGMWRALNASTLGHLKRSPAYCRHRLDNPQEETTALEFGKAIHCAVLEPAVFEERYRLDPPCPEDRNPKGWRNTKDYKSLRGDLDLRGFRLLKQSDFDAARRIRDQLYDTPSAAHDIVEAMTATEVSYVADDPATGLRCKVRPDIEVPSARMVVDLKTSRDASPWAFARSVYSFGYHRSKPFYLDVMNAEGSDRWEQYLFLVIENTPPYEFAVYDLDPSATELGRRDVEELKTLYLRCQSRDEWPGYSTVIETVGVPEFAYYNAEEENARHE